MGSITSHIIYIYKVYGAYGLSSLSEKTRKSNRLQMSLRKAALSPQLFKETKCGSGRDFIEPAVSRSADRRLSNRANRAAVSQI